MSALQACDRVKQNQFYHKKELLYTTVVPGQDLKTYKMENVSQNDWAKKIQNSDNCVVLDVRTPAEYHEGIQPNAQQINVLDTQNFLNEIEKLDKSKEYYVYCRSGGRSSQACVIMDSRGFKSTYNLLGGMSSWTGEVVLP